MTHSKELTLEEATAYLLEQAKYAAPADHPILGASLALPKEYGRNTQKNSAGKKAK